MVPCKKVVGPSFKELCLSLPEIEKLTLQEVEGILIDFYIGLFVKNQLCTKTFKLSFPFVPYAYQTE